MDSNGVYYLSGSLYKATSNGWALALLLEKDDDRLFDATSDVLNEHGESVSSAGYTNQAGNMVLTLINDSSATRVVWHTSSKTGETEDITFDLTNVVFEN